MPPRRDLSDRFARSGSDRKGKRRVGRPNLPPAALRPTPTPVAEPAEGEADERLPAPTAVPARSAAPTRPASPFAARRGGAASAAARAPRATLTTDFAAVRNDLRRISVLAGGILVLLVILSFVVR